MLLVCAFLPMKNSKISPSYFYKKKVENKTSSAALLLRIASVQRGSHCGWTESLLIGYLFSLSLSLPSVSLSRASSSNLFRLHSFGFLKSWERESNSTRKEPQPHLTRHGLDCTNLKVGREGEGEGEAEISWVGSCLLNGPRFSCVVCCIVRWLSFLFLSLGLLLFVFLIYWPCSLQGFLSFGEYAEKPPSFLWLE